MLVLKQKLIKINKEFKILLSLESGVINCK